MGDALRAKFDYAVQFIQNLPPKGDFQPSNEMKLSFYSLFKQGTVGDVNKAQPGMWYPIERAKWLVVPLPHNTAY